MKCAEVLYYLNDYSKGILLNEVRAEIHEHLNNCISCAKVFDEIIISKESGKKKINVNPREESWERIKKVGEKTRSTKKIISRRFPSDSTLSSETENLKNNFLVKANEIENNKLFNIAAIISAIALGIILAFMIFNNSPASFWSVEKISGYPVIETKVLTGQGIIKIGEKLYTDSESRARLKVGVIGEIDIEPESEIKIIETKTSEYRLVLSKGKISARMWSAPKLFSIKTPSAVVKDLGCMYYLSVNNESSTLLQVKSGWVLMENKNAKSLLTTGASCYSEKSKGLGTPFSNDASNLFKESLHKLDFENGGKTDLEKVLSESRIADLISLFHLLKRLDQESRGIIYDRISYLFKMPQRITRDGIISGNKDMIARLWVELGLGSISMYQNL